MKMKSVCFLLGNSPASEFYTPTFRNALSVPSLYPPMKMEQGVPKRRHIKFRCWGITQKKASNIQNTAKFWNKENEICLRNDNWSVRSCAISCVYCSPSHCNCPLFYAILAKDFVENRIHPALFLRAGGVSVRWGVNKRGVNQKLLSPIRNNALQ